MICDVCREYTALNLPPQMGCQSLRLCHSCLEHLEGLPLWVQELVAKEVLNRAADRAIVTTSTAAASVVFGSSMRLEESKASRPVSMGDEFHV